VFPGGELECVSNIQLRMERAGLEIHDVEALRPHYASTLRKRRAQRRAPRYWIFNCLLPEPRRPAAAPLALGQGRAGSMLAGRSQRWNVAGP